MIYLDLLIGDGMTGQENGKPGKENGNGGDAE